MKFKRLFDITAITANKFPNKIAFANKIKGIWKSITFTEYFNQSNVLSIWLLKNELNNYIFEIISVILI